MWEAIAFAVDELRQEYRIKQNIDYALLHRSEGVYIMCTEGCYYTIKEVLEKHHIPLNDIKVI